MKETLTQLTTDTEKLEQELAGLEQESKEKKGSDVELIQIEMEKITAEIEQKKEYSKEQGEKGTERVEKSDGEPEDVVDAKNAGEVLNTKTEEAAVEVEVEVKATEQKLKPSDTVTYEDVMEKRAEEAAQASEVEQKTEAEKPEGGVTGEGRSEKVKETRNEAAHWRERMEIERKRFALVHSEDPEYHIIKTDYELTKDAHKVFLIRTRKETLEAKGLLNKETGEYKKLTSEEINIEIGRYAREHVAPNFTVVEAAKIQAARSEANPSLLEKMKDNKFSKLAYGAVDMYRKANWKQKLALSVGLLGVGVAAGATGGTIGLALAGIVTGGKGIQRFLSGAGTAVATEALIQRSQQKWLEKEGWGKNRHEYIAKQIASLRESAKKGGVLSEAEVEKSLGEREEIEKSNEARRAILAGITGALVGSGAAWQAVKQAGEWTGVSGVLGTAKDYWFGKKVEAPLGGVEKAKEVAGAVKEQAKAVVAPVQEKIIPIAIGVRGPEGALIDNFKAHPDVAKAFGWDGKADLSKWAGAEANKLWSADAKEALKNPQILAQMEKLGFSKDAEGYAKMATRIGKGFVQIDPTGKNIKFADMEYLKNTNKDFEDFLDRIGKRIVGPAGIKEVPSVGAPADIGVEAPAPLHGAQKILHDLFNQQKLSEVESKMTPHMEEIIKGLKENGMSEEKITERMGFIAKAAAERAGIDLSALGKDMINVEALQQIMESPEGKIGGLVQKLVDSKVFTEEEFNSAIKNFGGMDKFMDAKFVDLFDKEPLFKKFAEGAGRAFGASDPNLYRRPIREVMEKIWYKSIFGGTAEDIIEGTTK